MGGSLLDSAEDAATGPDPGRAPEVAEAALQRVCTECDALNGTDTPKETA